MVFVGAGQVSASEIHIGTYSGNDSNTDLELIESWVTDWLDLDYTLELEEYAKVDFPGTESSDDRLTLSYNLNSEDESTVGTWRTSDYINMFSVKSTAGFALYWLGDADNPADSTFWGASSGNWITDLVGGQGISHFSAWTITGGDEPPAGQVPEPSTMLLFGLGILGLAGFGRKRLL
tara:strand:+ start:249 stop:782 length:534 start_codon:yes stop_codon:yes gene_type:complete